VVALSILDAFVHIGVLLTLAIPIAVLAAGALVYYFKAKYRMALGIILVSLGSFGAAIFGLVVYFSTFRFNVGVLFISIALFSIELVTLALGLLSITRKKLII
jgi:hypothetical protein